MPVTKQTIQELLQFAIAQLDADKSVERLDALLEEFEVAQRSPELVAMDGAAISAALHDYDCGERGRPIEEFETEFRTHYGIR
jgi:hypothetical protein